MPAYFDSNILLSILKNDTQAEQAAKLWEGHKVRVSSILLEIECLITLRRFEKQFGRKLPGDWLLSKEGSLLKAIESVTLRGIDSAIFDIIRHEPMLAQCRSLDTIHLATALYFQRNSEEPFYFFTFDLTVAEMARRFKFLT